jgi:hypothetical protein
VRLQVEEALRLQSDQLLLSEIPQRLLHEVAVDVLTGAEALHLEDERETEDVNAMLALRVSPVLPSCGEHSIDDNQVQHLQLSRRVGVERDEATYRRRLVTAQIELLDHL